MSVLMLSLKEGNFKMVQNEIKMKIDSNNREIEKLIQPFKFTLDSKIAELLSENEKLQTEFVDLDKNYSLVWNRKEIDNRIGL